MQHAQRKSESSLGLLAILALCAAAVMSLTSSSLTGCAALVGGAAGAGAGYVAGHEAGEEEAEDEIQEHEIEDDHD
jgi:hypothetical protein